MPDRLDLVARTRFRVRRAWHRASLRRRVARLDRPVLLTGIPGNVGDQLIWAGLEAACGDLLPRRLPLCEVAGARGATLVIPGSGAWSPGYHEWLPDLVVRCATRFEKVVVLPSSYDTRVAEVAAALAVPNLHPMARERESAALVRATRECSLSLDCAVYAGASFAPVPPDPAPRTLFALRTDRESALGRDGFRLSGRNLDISALAPSLDHWLAGIAAHGTVVTDRAHVMLAATLMGKKVYFHEGSYWKLSEIADYTFGKRRSWPQQVDGQGLASLGALEAIA